MQLASFLRSGTNSSLVEFGLFAIAAFGVGQLALARCVGLLHRALRMNAGG